MKNRVGRVIVAIIALLLFGVYLYKQEQIHTHSADIEWWGPATGLHPEGVDQGEVMAARPDAEPSPAEETPAAEPEETPAAEPEETSVPFDLTSWEFMLVNGEHSIDQYEPPELGWVSNTLADRTVYPANTRIDLVPVDARIGEALMAFTGACQDAGLPVFISSGYRSYSEQAANFQRICAKNGITDGKDANGHYITMPAGCSEHQSGLGVDITDYYRETKNDDFFQTPTYEWLRDHCAEYGFVLRFPTGKEDITGVMNEGWHFRYVGVEAAQYMTQNDLTLEELWQRFGNEA